jgi:SAM-dependent methyltransferase
LIGVGHGGLGEDENNSWYISAKYIFKGIILDAGISGQSKVLELGYGTGFYSRVCSEIGISDYTGLDIVNQHAEKLRAELLGYRFDKADIGLDKIECPGRDLVYMIDVSQHIVNDDKIKYCLIHNVADNLKTGGLFIVTDELENIKYAFYEKSRSVEFYQSVLDGFILEQAPILFRDKYIFSFRKQ